MAILLVPLDMTFPRSKLYDVSHRGQGAFELEPPLDLPGEFLARAVFAVREDDARPAGCEDTEPPKQVCLSGMGAESTERMHAGLDRDFLAVNANFLRALHELTPQRPAALVADDQHLGLWFPEVLFEVVQHATGIAHPGAG